MIKQVMFDKSIQMYKIQYKQISEANFLHLFAQLFHKDFSLLVRINCIK